MTSKRITPLLLAASVFLTGATGAFLGSMTPVHAITSVDELSDVNRNHWAFEALRDLVEKYDVIEGYPDHTFRGNRTATRWELAAALNALLKTVGKDLARLGAEKANKSDLAVLAKLQEEFREELNALTARVGALEGRATAIEAKNAEQDNRLTLLEKTQIHGDFSIGGISDIGANGTHAPGSIQSDGIRDAISAVGRMRLSLDIPVHEDRDDSLIGAGNVYARFVAGFGRIAPSGAQDGNLGAFNPFNGYSRIAGDASAFNEGFSTSSFNNGTTTGGGGNVRSNLYMETAFYRQHFKSGIPLLTDVIPGLNVFPDGDDWKTAGDLYVGVIPWRFLYDKSPFRGNELTQFQNTAFVNTPGVGVNYNMPMIAYQIHQGLGKSVGLDITSGVGSIDVGDLMDGLNLTYEARLNYLTSFLGEQYTKPGTLYAGGYHVWNAGNRQILGSNRIIPGVNGGAPLTNRSGGPLAGIGHADTNAFYVGWNQEWYKGIGTTVNYLLSNNSRTNIAYTSLQQPLGANAALNSEAIAVGVQQSLSGVLNIPMASIIPGWRDKDAIGVGYGFVQLQKSGLGGGAGSAGGVTGQVFRSALEQVAEAYYRWQVNDSISVVPSVQMIFNRLGIKPNGVTTVIGLRTNFTF